MVSKPQPHVPGDAKCDHQGPGKGGQCEDGTQLPVEDDNGDARTVDDHMRELGMMWLKKEHGMRREGDRKSQLEKEIYNQTFRIQQQQKSIDQLQQLVSDKNSGIKDCDEKLWQLHCIDEQLQKLPHTKDQTTPPAYNYTTWLDDRYPDMLAENVLIVIYRLSMTHESIDSVWLLHDGLDWLLPAVQILLLLQQTGGNTTDQCPADVLDEVQLLQKFTNRLEDWRKDLDEQQRIHSKLSMMLEYLPQHYRVRF